MQRKSKATIAGAIGLAMALTGQSPATATLLPESGWSLSSSTQTSTQLTGTAAVKPLVGDFNGDGRADVLFYAPGASADYLWTGQPADADNPSHRFAVTSMPVSGSYTPVVGDFDGNGADDIFWYAAGTPTDAVWYFDGGNISSSVSYNVVGSYTPVVSNFDEVDSDDDSQKDDIFFYSSGGTSTLWSGKTNRTFSSRTYPTAAPKGAQVLVGNFTIDHTDGTFHPDLLFYAPGTGADAFWTGDGTGAFTVTPKTINGNYVPVVGNFDLVNGLPESSLTDILWYTPGTGADSVWMNNGTSFTSTPLTINSSTYKPFVIPNILGADTIMWNNPSGPDYQWQTRGSVAFDFVSIAWPAGDMGTRTPIVGQFDDQLPRLTEVSPYGADVLWAQAGNTAAQTEIFWAGCDAGKWVLPVVPPVEEI